jgi:ribosomal protein S18 acetylase RimI-like enzyme
VIATRRAGVDDLDRCADVLALAFADYPWTRWTVESAGHLDRVRALQLLALQRLSLPFGQVWCTLCDGVIESVAAWMDSALPVPPSVFEAMADEVAVLEGARHEASVSASANSVDITVAGRSFHLGTVGTAPAQQRRGFAARTLAPVLDEADSSGVSCTLETSSASNVAFYERLGFDVASHRSVPGGGPDVWAMLRAPHGVVGQHATPTTSSRAPTSRAARPLPGAACSSPTSRT